MAKTCKKLQLRHVNKVLFSQSVEFTAKNHLLIQIIKASKQTQMRNMLGKKYVYIYITLQITKSTPVEEETWNHRIGISKLSMKIDRMGYKIYLQKRKGDNSGRRG